MSKSKPNGSTRSGLGEQDESKAFACSPLVLSQSRSTKMIGITLGDPCGIGPEVVAKALAQSSLKSRAHFVIIGEEQVFRYYSKNQENCTFIDLKNFPQKNFMIGKSNPVAARASLEYLHKAVELLKEKKITALVTAPVCKGAICALGIPFAGHTEFLADAFKVKNFGMMFVAENLKTILVTRHIPLNAVSRAINSQNIYETINLVYLAFQKYFKIIQPRIAVCGLNPHAGEGGTIGTEEITKIIPAIQKARKKGIHVLGPFPSDTLFSPQFSLEYDAIVVMYHDQGLIPIKAMYFSKLVNLTVGLPFIRTSPAHGTAFNIAGQNKADPSSMVEAIKLAEQLS